MLRVSLFAMSVLLAATSAWTQDTVPDAAPEPAVEPVTEPAPEPAPEPVPATVPGGFVVVCPIEEMVDDGMAVIVERAVREAEGAAALIFEVDTPGGRVDSAIEITKSIMSADCPTIAQVQGMGAISAGALISYACDHIVMASGTNIGASAPIIMGGAEPSEEVNEKTKSFLRGRYRALGEEKGHSPLLGEAMVDAGVELRGYMEEDGTFAIFRVDRDSEDGARGRGFSERFDELKRLVREESPESLEEFLADEAIEIVRQILKEDEVAPEDAAAQRDEDEQAEILSDGTELICGAGELLTLTSNEAWRYGLIPVKCNSLAETMSYHGYHGMGVKRITPTWSEALFRWLTSPMISGLLLMLGVGGLYIEIRTPGVGLPGIIGAVCLAIFFGSYLVIGLADWVDILLVVVGIALIAAEVFLIPGFGVAGVAGGVCLVAGLYLSLTRVPIPQYAWDFDRLEDAGQTLFTAAVTFAALTLVSWKILPKTPFARWLVLSNAQLATAGYVVQTEAQTTAAMGLRGVSASMLRPAGRGRFGLRRYNVVTRGEFIEKGRPIEIIEAEGNRYVVVEREARKEG